MTAAPLILETYDVAETLALGRRLGGALAPGTVVALVGTLGSGKTHLVKGVAAGAGVPQSVTVNSPTFVLVNEYAGRLHLYHIDVYRLHGPVELDTLGFDEMLAAGGAVLIEWADRVAACLPVDRLQIEIEITGETRRRFTCTAGGLIATTVLGRVAQVP